MAEDTTVSQPEGGAPAEAPAPASQDEIRQMVEAEAQRIVDARIPGLQSAYEKQIAGLRKELKTAQSDPSGYQTDADTQLQQELEQARREADALRAGRQYPTAYPVYEALMAAGSAEEQMELLESFVQGKPAEAQAQQTPEASTPPASPPATPPVDRNPPAQPPQTPAGDFASVEEAESFIGKFTSWPKFGG